jgi:hypothetical protein
MSRKVSAVDTRTNSTKVTLLTVPTKNTGLWTTMYVISTAGTETPKVYWYDASANTEYFVIGGKNLGAGDYILLADKEVVLQAGDEIRIQNTGTSAVTYIATVEFVPETAVQFQY